MVNRYYIICILAPRTCYVVEGSGRGAEPRCAPESLPLMIDVMHRGLHALSPYQQQHFISRMAAFSSSTSSPQLEEATLLVLREKIAGEALRYSNDNSTGQLTNVFL